VGKVRVAPSLKTVLRTVFACGSAFRLRLGTLAFKSGYHLLCYGKKKEEQSGDYSSFLGADNRI